MLKSSVGVVTPEIVSFDEPLHLTCNQTLDKYDLVIETYGTLNTQKNNAILICHALSGHHHAAGCHSLEDKQAGWWDNCIGPNKPIDTNRFFVVCLNNLGGCHGSTGPNTINPKTQKAYGASFPIVTIQDWVVSQARLSDRLEIKQWAAIVGGSLGGMQVLQWCISYPNRLKHAVIIASASKLSAQNIAFNEVARQAIMSDHQFHDGNYYDENTIPRQGLRIARMIGHITYLSDEAMREKFGRSIKKEELGFDYDVQFQVESYLRYQGKVFSEKFDANSYLLMTRALDYFDPASEYDDDLAKALKNVTAKFLLISFTTDWRFSPKRSKEIVDALLDAKKQVSYLEIESPQGHDAFLMDIPRYLQSLSTYFQDVAKNLNINCEQ